VFHAVPGSGQKRDSTGPAGADRGPIRRHLRFSPVPIRPRGGKVTGHAKTKGESCSRFEFTAGAARASSRRPRCCPSRPSRRAATRRPSPVSVPSAPARRWWPSAASPTRRSACASRSWSPTRIIIQDPTLLHQVDVFAGLKKDGYILINTTKTFEQLGLGDFVRDWHPERLCTVAATDLSLKHVGRPVPNVPLLGGFAAVSGIIKLESVAMAIRDKFSGKVAEGNIAAATEAYNIVVAEMKEALPPHA
jgi:2-oxoacid:acceptor oxidoreductase gamma subunit (pyruvate/2-ketoisovalerate family)